MLSCVATGLRYGAAIAPMPDLTALIPDTPLFAFTLLILVILVIPPIFERLRLPGLVGLLVAGVCLGPSGYTPQS